MNKLPKTEIQLKREAIIKAAFGKKSDLGRIAKASEALGYRSNKTLYNIIDSGLTPRSERNMINCGFAKLAKKLKSIPSQ